MPIRTRFVLFLLILSLFFVVPFSVRAQVGDLQEKVASKLLIKLIEVRGNKAISAPTIMSKIKTRVGQPYYSQTARDDIKRLYQTGFFSDISLDLEDVEDGLKVVFKVQERPVVEQIDITGNRVMGRHQLLSRMKTKPGQYLSYAVLKEDINAIRKEYERKGMSHIALDHDITTDEATNKAKIVLRIQEGRRVKIRRIYVEGNLSVSDRKILSLMKTKRAGFFNAGYFKEDQFRDDLERVKVFYLQEGYLDVRVDYRIDHDVKNYKYIRLQIEEGRQYRVGDIRIEGNKQFSDEEVFSSLTVCRAGDIFTYDALREDVSNIQGFYFGRGYIFMQVRDAASLDASRGTVDITYKITENEVAYVGRVDIRGNLKTQDKVVRRELRIRPGDRFDGGKLKRSKERLYNLGYFEEISYDTEPGLEPRERNLILDVKEAKTGSFSFGGGYSSIDQVVGFIEIEQRNFDWKNWKTFTGGGQDLKLRGEFGSVRQNFELSFTEPWIFDRPLSFGFDLYNRTHDKESDIGYGYIEKRTGGDLRLGKEFSEYVKGGLTYRFENVDISEVAATASSDLKNEEGETNISSLEFALTRDTTDNVFNPSRGLVISGSLEMAGGILGGDKNFNKIFCLVSKYTPLFNKGVLQLQARVGLVQAFDDTDKVPIYERFYAGGANTVRGYEERSIGPIDSVTNDPLGGEVFLVANAEYAVPLLDFIKGAVFIDMGNVWADTSDVGSGEFKTGVGLGVRVKTPIGPLKLDYGIPLEPQPGQEDKKGRFHFSMSHGF